MMNLEATPQFSSIHCSHNTSSISKGSSSRSGRPHQKLVKSNAFHVFTFETPAKDVSELKS